MTEPKRKCVDCGKTGTDLFLSFFVPGNPKGRVHTRAAMNRKTGRVFTRADASTEQLSWTSAVRSAAMQVMDGDSKIETGAVALSVEFVMPRPKGYNWKTAHAEPRCCRGLDLGNLTKALEDSLNGVVWRDDSQIAEYRGPYLRRYARPGEACGARVRVWALGEWYEELAWGTRLEQWDDRRAQGNNPKGEQHHAHKLTAAQAAEIRTDRSGRASRVVAREYGVSHTTILAIRRGTRWQEATDGQDQDTLRG